MCATRFADIVRKGLVAELAQAKTTLETAGLAVQCDAATTVKLPAVQESVLSLAVREAVTNVVRHAQARTCRMRLEQQNGSCRFEIQDDGLRQFQRRGQRLARHARTRRDAGRHAASQHRGGHDTDHHAASERSQAETRRLSAIESLARENAKEGRKTIRVVLAEDQGMVLGALAALLEIEGDISVVAQARNGKEALDAVLAHKPDVFITDIEMPHMSGLDVAAELKRRKTGRALSS